jgi:hypothetical protein
MFCMADLGDLGWSPISKELVCRALCNTGNAVTLMVQSMLYLTLLCHAALPVCTRENSSPTNAHEHIRTNACTREHTFCALLSRIYALSCMWHVRALVAQLCWRYCYDAFSTCLNSVSFQQYPCARYCYFCVLLWWFLDCDFLWMISGYHTSTHLVVCSTACVRLDLLLTHRIIYALRST